MSLREYIDELTKLNLEISRNLSNNKKIRVRTKELEEMIKDYMGHKKQSGIKYNGQAILLENKEKRTIKPKKEKKHDSIKFLQSLGLEKPEEVYLQLEEVKKGNTIEHSKLKFTKL